MLTHVCSAFSLSNGTYASPRMTRELQDDGFGSMREDSLPGRQDCVATAPNQK